MEALLNKGFNFSILPKKLDITQTMVDFKRLERSVIWMEFFNGKEINEHSEALIFKTYKNNMPKNYTVPEGLKIFLGAIKSEILDSKNRNSAECNLTREELEALKELITMQKDRKIVIKPCDKGAGILILDFEDYLKACYTHLTAEASSGEPYYSPVNVLEIEKNKNQD